MCSEWHALSPTLHEIVQRASCLSRTFPLFRKEFFDCNDDRLSLFSHSGTVSSFDRFDFFFYLRTQDFTLEEDGFQQQSQHVSGLSVFFFLTKFVDHIFVRTKFINHILF